MSAKQLVKEIYIDAPPEIVFEFLTDPEKMVRWMGLQAELDPRPGGIYRIDPNGRDMIRGSYIEVSPHSRIVFSFGWEQPGGSFPPGSTTVQIDLKPEGEGTRLLLIHSALPPDAVDRHDLGWTHYLSRLQTVSEGQDAGLDPLADPTVRHG